MRSSNISGSAWRFQKADVRAASGCVAISAEEEAFDQPSQPGRRPHRVGAGAGAVLGPSEIERPLLHRRHPKFTQIVECAIVIRWRAGQICGVAWWNKYDHPLSGTCEQDTIRISKIILILRTLDVLPTVATEIVKRPPVLCEAKISVPCYADPVELETLYLEFRRRVFEIIT